MRTIFTPGRTVLTAALAMALLVATQPRTHAQSDEVVRTADINLRGLSRRDFPRVHKLADNVYVFSAVQTRTDIEMEFTTNNLMVQPGGGVAIPFNDVMSVVGQVDYRRVFSDEGDNVFRYVFGLRFHRQLRRGVEGGVRSQGFDHGGLLGRRDRRRASRAHGGTMLRRRRTRGKPLQRSGKQRAAAHHGAAPWCLATVHRSE